MGAAREQPLLPQGCQAGLKPLDQGFLVLLWTPEEQAFHPLLLASSLHLPACPAPRPPEPCPLAHVPGQQPQQGLGSPALESRACPAVASLYAVRAALTRAPPALWSAAGGISSSCLPIQVTRRCRTSCCPPPPCTTRSLSAARRCQYWSKVAVLDAIPLAGTEHDAPAGDVWQPGVVRGPHALAGHC